MRTEYHKIQTFFNRDPAKDFRKVIMGEYATPEFEFLAYSDWEWSEKLDGMNIRVIFDGNSVTFAGKTDAAELPPQLFTLLSQELTVDRLSRAFDVERLSSDCPAVLYCEGVGPGIQKKPPRFVLPQSFDRHGLTQTYVMFDLAVGGVFLHRYDWVGIAGMLGIKIAELVGVGNMWEALLFVEGHPDMEGVVCRPRRELCNRLGRRIITKLKYKDLPDSV